MRALKARAANVSVEGNRQFNPGWHLALDLQNMVTVSECIAMASLLREESRGGHTREDFPTMDPSWRSINLICSLNADGDVEIAQQPLPDMPGQLLNLFTAAELVKYVHDHELAEHSEGAS